MPGPNSAIQQGSYMNDVLLNQPMAKAGGFPQVFKTGAGSVVGHTVANPMGGAPLLSPYFASHVSGLPGFNPNAEPVQRPVTTGQYPTGSSYGLAGPNLGSATINPAVFLGGGMGMGGMGGIGMGGGMGGLNPNMFGAGSGGGMQGFLSRPGAMQLAGSGGGMQGFLSRPGAMQLAGNVNLGPGYSGGMGTTPMSMYGMPLSGAGMGIPGISGGYYNPSVTSAGQTWGPLTNSSPTSPAPSGGAGGSASIDDADFYDTLLQSAGSAIGGGGMGYPSQPSTGGVSPSPPPFSFFSGPNSTPTAQTSQWWNAPQSQQGGSQPQEAAPQTYGAFNAPRQATSPGNVFSEAAAQYHISPLGYRPGYALPQPGYGAGYNPNIGNFSVTGQAEELPSGLGGSRTVSGLTGAGGRNYLSTGMRGGAGGIVTTEDDVNFFLDQGILSPDQADVLKQIAAENQKAGQGWVKDMGSFAPSSSAFKPDEAKARRFA